MAIMMNALLFFFFILAVDRLESHLDAKRDLKEKNRKHAPKLHL